LKKTKLTLVSLILCLILALCGCLDTADSSSDIATSNSSDSFYSSQTVADISSAEDEILNTSNTSEKLNANTDKTSSQAKPSNNNNNNNSNSNNIPEYSGKPYVVLNGNKPSFTKDMLIAKSYESYSPLDSLNRCSVAVACIGKDIMPTEDRDSIGQVKPSGWQTVKYDIVDGKYLYNRCHLIGYQLTGENANTKNLITGTRYLNVEGMLPFENMVADYIKETGNHVIYRVTPIFKDNNLVASGVQIEGYSVEDLGDGICFNVYCYNVQPGIVIDYATGKSKLKNAASVSSKSPTSSSNVVIPPPSHNSSTASSTPSNKITYTLNTNSKKIHYPSCSSAKKIKEENRGEYSGTNLKSLLDQGYTYCGICFK